MPPNRVVTRGALQALHPWQQQFTQQSALTYLRYMSQQPSRPDSTEPPAAKDFRATFAKPSWSVRSLLPAANSTSSSSENQISPTQLHHLLRLSALPLPETPEEEAKMIQVLQSQLHFVQDIQKVDTEGVEPLRSIRDETQQGIQENTIGLEQLREALSQETIFGHSRRPRRQKADRPLSKAEDWDVFQTASRKAGKYFVVESGKS